MASGWDYEAKEASSYLKVADGQQVQIRICSTPFPFTSVFDGGQSADRVGFVVIVREAGNLSVKVWQCANQLYKKLKEFHTNPMWGDVTRYDFFLSRKGSGLQTEWSIMPSPEKRDLTAEERKLLSDANINLVEACLTGNNKPIEGFTPPSAAAAPDPYAE